MYFEISKNLKTLDFDFKTDFVILDFVIFKNVDNVFIWFATPS